VRTLVTSEKARNLVRSPLPSDLPFDLIFFFQAITFQGLCTLGCIEAQPRIIQGGNSGLVLLDENVQTNSIRLLIA
jgi:hypothetical protein